MLQYNTHKLLDIDDDPTSKSDESGDVSGRTDHRVSRDLHAVHTTPRRYGYLGVLNRTNTECVPGPRNVVETNLAAVNSFTLYFHSTNTQGVATERQFLQAI